MNKLYSLAEIMDDAENYGNAINKAGWKFIEVYRKVMGEECPGKLFNYCKEILSPVIMTYLRNVDEDIRTAHPESD